MRKIQLVRWVLASIMAPGLVLAQPETTFEYDSQFGSQGTVQGTFTSPTGVSFHSTGRVIVADRGNLNVQSCSLQGDDCFWVGNNFANFRNQPGTFDLPHGVEGDGSGLIAVADEDNHAVQLCDNLGNCIYRGTLNSENNPPSAGFGKWAFPSDVAFDSQGRVHGLDTGNDRIQILRRSDLAFRGVYMSSGSAPGQVNGPKGMAIDAHDMVIIADTGNHRIQVCDTDANCTAFGSIGNGVGQFMSPVGVEVDSLDRIWVADTGNHRIQVCDYQGACLAFGGFGTSAGQFDAPTDVAVHATGKVAVVDSNNHRIQIFNTESGFVINAGLNDAWFNPQTPGQGFFVNVFPVLGKVFMAMFAFDTERPAEEVTAILGGPGQRWLTAFGDYAGNLAVLPVELTTGGIFDAAEPAVSQIPGYGTFTIEFHDCNNATITYDFPALGRSGTIPVTRVTGDNIALCQALLDG